MQVEYLRRIPTEPVMTLYKMSYAGFCVVDRFDYTVREDDGEVDINIRLVNTSNYKHHVVLHLVPEIDPHNPASGTAYDFSTYVGARQTVQITETVEIPDCEADGDDEPDRVDFGDVDPWREE